MFFYYKYAEGSIYIDTVLAGAQRYSDLWKDD